MNKPSFPSLYHHPWANEVTRSGHEWSDTDDVVRSVFQSVTPFHIHPPLPCQSVTLPATPPAVNELGERMKGTDRVSITFLLTSHDSLRSTVSPHTHSPSLLSSCHSLRSFHSGHTKEEWVSVAPCGESRVMMVWGHSLSLSCGPSWRTGRGLTHGHAARLFGLTSWWTGWQVHRRDPFVTLPSDPFYHSL